VSSLKIDTLIGRRTNAMVTGGAYKAKIEGQIDQARARALALKAAATEKTATGSRACGPS